MFVASYIEVAPRVIDQAAALLRREREAARDDTGLVQCEVLQRLDRPNQFVALSCWSTQQALEAHRQTRHVADLDQELAALLLAPCDSRLHRRLTTSETMPPSDRDITVVTHVDVTPQHKDAAVTALLELAAAGRTHGGNHGFEVWQQLDRPNHFSLVERWIDSETLEAHGMASATRACRQTLAPMLGALFDDRRYRALG